MARKIRWGVISTALIGTAKVIPGMQRSKRGTVDAIASLDLKRAKSAAPHAAHAAAMDGNVRVGLEDSRYIARGVLAKSNAEQVAKIRRIVLGHEIATPNEARAERRGPRRILRTPFRERDRPPALKADGRSKTSCCRGLSASHTPTGRTRGSAPS